MNGDLVSEEPYEHHPIDSSRFEPLGETRAFRHLQTATKVDLDMVLPPLVGTGVLAYVQAEAVNRGGVGPWYYSDGSSWLALSGIGGSGIFAYDYLVDYRWAVEVAGGRGTEGQTLYSVTGFPFKAYSTIGAAIVDIVSENGAQWYTVAICPGTYDETIAWPSSGNAPNIRGVALHAYEGSGSRLLAGNTIIGANAGLGIQCVNGNPKPMKLENITLQGGSGNCLKNDLLGGGGINWEAYVLNCSFIHEVDPGDTGGFQLHGCRFWSSIVFSASSSPSDFLLDDCVLHANLDLQDCRVDQVSVVACDFVAGAIKLGRGVNVTIDGNTFSKAGGGVITLTTAMGGYTAGVIISDNTFTQAPPQSGAIILLHPLSTGQVLLGVTITGNAFPAVPTLADSSTAYIKLSGSVSDKTLGAIVEGNAFGQVTNGTTIEDRGGYSIIGTYVERSVFGPNVPATHWRAVITNGVDNEYYPGTAAGGSEGNPPDVVEGILYDDGGLNLGYRDFLCRFDNTVLSISASTLALPASQTSYAEVDSSGTVSSNTTGYTLRRIPLGRAVTDGSSITSITEESAVLDQQLTGAVGYIPFGSEPITGETYLP